MTRRPGLLINIVHVFMLCSFAVAQPLFDLLARDAAFLVVHRAGMLDVLGLIGLLCVVIPSGFGALELAARAFGMRSQEWMHYGNVAFLVTVVSLPPLVTVDSWSGALLFGLAAGIGVAVTVCYAAFSSVRLFFTLLSPAILFFPTLFLFHPEIAPVMFSRSEMAPSLAKPVSLDPRTRNMPSVVLVVLDELPLTSLLDEQYQIDATLYPHFAELAQNATWFRNAVTEADGTLVAVPIILSGERPRPDAQPTYESYPENIFTLLAQTHELHVFESHTRLCPETLCPETSHQRFQRARFLAIVDDLSKVYLHIILPEDYTSFLPSVTHTWKDFGGGLETVLQKAHRSYGDRSAKFSRFVASITATARPGLHVIHILLPHVPWEYSPSGVMYPRSSRRVPGLNVGTETWDGDATLVRQGYERHLWQVRLADRLIGQLLSRLRGLNLHGESLIIVTADHGASFWPNSSRRNSVEPHLADIRRVPLFLKAPFQDTGAVTDRRVSTLDIVPTIVEVLGIEPPGNLDGDSLYSPSLDAPGLKSAALAPLGASLDRKLALFATDSANRTETPESVPSGGYRSLRGRAIRELSMVRASTRHATLDLAPQSFDVENPVRIVPAHITGILSGESKEQDVLAVAINGTIQDVMPIVVGPEEEWFSFLVPEEAFQIGSNEPTFFLVTGPATCPELALVSFSWRSTS